MSDLIRCFFCGKGEEAELPLSITHEEMEKLFIRTLDAAEKHPSWYFIGLQKFKNEIMPDEITENGLLLKANSKGVQQGILKNRIACVEHYHELVIQ